ncbi:MAG: GntR family transcriptional regulator [Candidatus Eremiobacteraeota bacterium]|nr:GntR family transcriptional regulator [Candidatus Eremiobacteraeota bacterium]
MTAAGQVSEILRRAIIDGELQAGEILRQEELAARLGVSRIPLREALRQLEGEGFVTSTPHRGVVVAGFSMDELREISEIRSTLESQLLRLAIPQHTEQTIRQCETIADEIDADERALDDWAANNWRFHSALYAPAARPRTLALAASYHTHTQRYLGMHIRYMNYKREGQREHRKLLELTAKHQTEKAVELLQKHIGDVVEMLRDFTERERAMRQRN